MEVDTSSKLGVQACSIPGSKFALLLYPLCIILCVCVGGGGLQIPVNNLISGSKMAVFLQVLSMHFIIVGRKGGKSLQRPVNNLINVFTLAAWASIFGPRNALGSTQIKLPDMNPVLTNTSNTPAREQTLMVQERGQCQHQDTQLPCCHGNTPARGQI